MHKISLFIAALSAGWIFSGSVLAQQTIPLGTKLQFGEDQKVMLDAAAKTLKRDFKGAEVLYSKAIDINKSNIDAYMQRGIVRHELGNASGAASDGQATVTLANSALRNNPNDPNLYYKRGMGFRLLKRYDQAKQDISNGMRLGGSSSWQMDLQSIDFEQKESGQQ